MSLHCCVPGCDNDFGSSEAEKGSITFHSFPKNELPRLAWIKATCRRKITRVPHSAVVCSDHFKEDDFVVDTHKLMLKRGAIPSIFTPAQIQLMEEGKEYSVLNITQQEKKKYSLPNITHQEGKECSVPSITQQQVKDTGEGLDTSQCHQAQTDSMCKNTNRKVTDISLLCRICAKRSDRLIPIFEGEGLIVDLAVKMQQYLSMKVTKDDDLPVKVCVSCATAVISWHDLVLMTIQANKELNAILENDIGNSQRTFSSKGTMQQKGSVSNDGNLQNQEQDYINSSLDQGMDVSGQLDRSLGAADKTSTHIGLAGKDKIEDLQQYKLHYPWKYHEVAGTIFLRTKVLGFEPAAAAFMYTCCLCCEEMKDSDVIAHSKSHYPLKISDTCRLCHFSFSSIHLLRNHIKRHLIIIDDEYVTKTPPPVTKAPSPITKPSSTVTRNVAAHPNTTKLKIESRVVPAKPLQKSKPPYVCEYCGIEYRRKGLYVRHVRNQHLLPFRCRMCQKRFDSLRSMDNHECSAESPWTEVDEITTESCNSDDLTCKCGKTFNTFEEYKEHNLTCDQDILCEECGLVFQTRKDHRKHMATHSKIPVRKEGASWICEICGCKLGKHSARKHYMTHSFKEKKFTCEICKMNFLHRWSLVNHMQSHSDIRPFVCEICSKTFKRSDHLREHQLNKHQIGKSKPNDFKCDVCNRYFTSETYLIRHKRLHSTGMSYECQVCKGRFPTEHSLKMHQTRMKHDGGNLDTVILSTSASDRINKFRCKFCFQRYGSMASLKKHRLKHCSKSKMKVEVVEENEDEPTETKTTEENSELEKTYECPKCNLRYLTDFGLKLHFARSKHSEVSSKYKKRPKKDPNEVKNPRFKCVQCNDIFSSLVSLRMHKIKRKHFSQCPHCGKRFAMEFKLKLHLVKVHQQKDVIVEESDLLTQEEKLPYQCATCSQLFAMKHNLESHMTKKHSGNEEDPTSRPSRSSGRKKPKTEPIDVFEEFTQEVSVIYHCTECWENFASEEDFNNHTHEANIILTEGLPENAVISEVIESES